MFLKIWEKFVELVIDASIFTEVKMYKGELEEGAEFTETFPVCYLEFDGDNMQHELAGSQIGESVSQLEFYIAADDQLKPLILDKCNELIDFFDGKDVLVDTSNFKCRYARTSLHAYIPGLGKAYRVTFEVY